MKISDYASENSTLARIIRSPLVEYVAYLTIALAIYAPLVYVGYVTDYLGWYDRVVAGGLSGALHSYDYGGTAPVYSFLMWATVHLRAISPYLVLLLACGLYAGAGLGIARVTERFAALEGFAHGRMLGSIAAVLWLLAPHNTEIMVWRVCLHYLLTANVWCLIVLAAVRYSETGKPRLLAETAALQAVALLALELTYALPFAVAATTLWCSYRYFDRRWLRPAVFTVLNMILVGAHLGLHKALNGVWIGHYGVDTATAEPLTHVLSAPWKYIVRSFAYVRAPLLEPLKSATVALGHPLAISFLYSSLVLAFAYGAFAPRARTQPTWLLALYLALMGCGVAAVAPLYYYDLLSILNDRLATLATLFAAGFAATACGLAGRFWPAVATVTITWQLLFLVPNLRHWSLSGDIVYNLTHETRELCQDIVTAPAVYLIAYAQNAGGAYTFADLAPYSVPLLRHVEREFGIPCRAMRNVAFLQFNQQSADDRVVARWREGKLDIALDAPGAWLWRNEGMNAARYDSLGVKLAYYDYSVVVTFSEAPPAGSLFLYQDGLSIRKLPYPTPESPQPSGTHGH